MLTTKYTLCLFVCFIITLVETVYAFKGIPGLYCGLENCYDVLGANKESSKDDITKLYRNLARKWHPDRFMNSDQKAAATEKFRQIATAYEVLREDESRKDYNDMLDDPEHYYRHYYRYYRRVYGAKVDAHWVILGVISVISLYQYFVMHSRYNEAINYFMTVPKYRFKAIELAKQKGWLPISDKRSGRDPVTSAKVSRHRSKEEMREQEESIIRRVIEENIDIRGGVAKPTLKNILWIQIMRSPLTLYNYLCWKIRWIYRFDIKGEPYGEDEKIYLISKYLGVSEDQLLTEENVDLMLKQELWIKEKFDAWKERREEEMRENLAMKPGYKRYRRYMKKGGPGQITFLDD
jgi:DnaJ family protein C protein 25